MAYDFVRWGIALVIFIVLSVVLIKLKRNKAKSILIASFAAIISFAVLLLFPIENLFYGFKTVEQIYSYRYHEDLLTYAECDEGVVCIGQKDAYNFVYYTFEKNGDKFKLPKLNEEKIMVRSSKFGIYMIKAFNNQIVIVTQASNSEYNGEKFKPCSSGYFSYTVVQDRFNYSLLTCDGEKVSLM